MPSSFRMLSLPPELRLEVYRYYIAARPVKVHCTKTVPPPLAHVCKLLRAEFLPVFEDEAILTSTSIKATVWNLDFRNLTSFVQRQPLLRGEKQKLNITIKFTSPQLLHDKNLTRLAHWINACEVSEKMGMFERSYFAQINLQTGASAATAVRLDGTGGGVCAWGENSESDDGTMAMFVKFAEMRWKGDARAIWKAHELVWSSW